MTDTQSIILAWFAKKLVQVFGLVLLPWNWVLSIKNKTINRDKYEVSRGWDILANKLYANVFNATLGVGFGGDETISQCMARNKRNGTNTKTAIVVEKIINIFDKNHLDKIKKK